MRHAGLLREIQITQFVFNNFLFPESRAFYETMWKKNVLGLDRPQVTM